MSAFESKRGVVAFFRATKLAALESLAPEKVERHLQTRINTYALAREEVRALVETRSGLRVRGSKASTQPQQSSQHNDPMDRDPFQEAGKGKKDKDQKSEFQAQALRTLSLMACATSVVNMIIKQLAVGVRVHPKVPPPPPTNGKTRGKGKKGGKGKTSAESLGPWEADDEMDEPEIETSAIHVCAVDPASCPPPLGPETFYIGELLYEELDESGKVWVRYNVDSGAGLTASPEGLGVPDPSLKGDKRYRFKTATGEMLADGGLKLVRGRCENGVVRNTQGGRGGGYRSEEAIGSYQCGGCQGAPCKPRRKRRRDVCLFRIRPAGPLNMS